MYRPMWNTRQPTACGALQTLPGFGHTPTNRDIVALRATSNVDEHAVIVRAIFLALMTLIWGQHRTCSVGTFSFSWCTVDVALWILLSQFRHLHFQYCAEENQQHVPIRSHAAGSRGHAQAGKHAPRMSYSRVQRDTVVFEHQNSLGTVPSQGATKHP